MQDPNKKYPIDELKNTDDPQLAAEIIRNKLDSIYGKEPSAKAEIQEVEHIPAKKMSKHQHYMDELSKSGLSLHEIQTKWHEYYQSLPDGEKRQVWNEFYRYHADQKTHQPTHTTHKKSPHHPAVSRPPRTEQPTRAEHTNSQEAVKKDLLNRVQTRARPISKNHHVRSLIFGFSMGALVLLIFLFSFFNERFITPFIRPSTQVSASPIIVDPTGAGQAAGPENKIIIPKINVEAPVVYDAPSIEEKEIQKALERGVVHYPTTPNPGEKGNAVIFGHSSGNILNSGKYKFAFILLKSLDKGDIFIVDKDGQRYVYKVYDEYVTSPTDTGVLNTRDRPATMTLVTCDPPGMSTNRLIIVGEQIFPDPSKNKESSVPATAGQPPQTLPSNSPSLWQRIQDWFSN